MARKPNSSALAPAEWSEHDAYAIKALATGTANPGQQQRALAWIINAGARTYDVSFHPGSDRETSFAEGRRFVGLQIVKLVNLPAELIKKA
jgi:hypothetical protein